MRMYCSPLAEREGYISRHGALAMPGGLLGVVLAREMVGQEALHLPQPRVDADGGFECGDGGAGVPPGAFALGERQPVTGLAPQACQLVQSRDRFGKLRLASQGVRSKK